MIRSLFFLIFMVITPVFEAQPMGALNTLWGGVKSTAAWPFKQAGGQFVAGATEQLSKQSTLLLGDPAISPAVTVGVINPLVVPPVNPIEQRATAVLNAFFSALSKSLKSEAGGAGSVALHEAVQSFSKELAKLFEKPAGGVAKNAAGRDLLNNFVRSLGDLVRKDGEGRKALEDFIILFSDFIKEEGVIKKALQDAQVLVFEEFKAFFDEIKRLNLDGGEARQAAGAFLENLNSMAEGTTQNINLVGGTANAHAAQLAQNIEAMGKGLNAQLDVMNEKIDAVGETFNTQYEKVIIKTVVAGVVLITSWYGSQVLWRYVERTITKPKLILESSEKSLWKKAKEFFVAENYSAPEMIFNPFLQQRLNNIAAATKNIRKKIQDGQQNIKYRNLLLWGPPGTGKTMFARILARTSGMDYAMMSGASFAQFQNGTGITEMNNLFDWANKSENGLLIFIDEAESFLGGRVGADVTQQSYQLLNNFLNHTGTRSNKVMFVFATNHREFLDKAMMRRIDDSVEIKLPDEEERIKMLALYRNNILYNTFQNSPEFITSAEQCLSDEIIVSLAQRTQGLSGGELEGIMNALISDASITDSGLITHELVDVVVGQAVQKNREFIENSENKINRPRIEEALRGQSESHLP